MCARNELELRWELYAKELAQRYNLLYKSISCNSTSKEGRHGVDVVFSSDEAVGVMKVMRESDKIIAMRVNCGTNALCGVDAYTWPAGVTEVERGIFLGKIEYVIECLPTEKRILVGAELNGHVREDNYGIKRIHGRHGNGRVNRDEERLVNLALSFNLMIAGTLFSIEVKHNITSRCGNLAAKLNNVKYRR